MNDDKLLEKIKQSADSCKVPEALKPEAIGSKLYQKPHLRKHRIYIAGGIAAAVLVVVIVAAALPNIVNNSTTENQQLEQDASSDSSEESIVAARSEDSDIGVKELDSLYVQAKDYEDVREALQTEYVYDSLARDGVTSSGSTEDSIAVEGDMSSESASMSKQEVSEAADYSSTNLQVEGVDEGDVVKTDGQYLFIIHEQREVRIVKIDGAKMKETAVINLDEEQQEESIEEIYLTGTTLNIISQGYQGELQQKGQDTYYYDYTPVTSVYTYDLSNHAQPELTGHVSQDGYYSTSRKTDGYIYLFSDYNLHDRYARFDSTAFEAEQLIPTVNGERMAAADIYLPQQSPDSSYMVISSISMENPDQIVDKKAIIGDSGQFYVTTENIYIQSNNWNYRFDNTNIAKFHFEKGRISGESACLIRGTITDSFAINEYDGYLRVLTSSWSDGEVNYVYVLDDKLNITGKIEGLAKGESIYSARFMGETGYFVTYRQVDPLFTVDFSDPQNPQILGELKVTGFSEYLHFYGEDRLLGIGWETDPDSGDRLGLKLSMFDISNPRKVKQINKIVIENIDYFPGEYNYKALTVNPGKNVIGLVTTAFDDWGDASSYMVFSYSDAQGFENELTYIFANSSNYYNDDNENARGVYVGDTFYVVSGSEIRAFDMNDGYKKIAELIK